MSRVAGGKGNGNATEFACRPFGGVEEKGTQGLPDFTFFEYPTGSDKLMPRTI
jgi:hypothetical protein